MNLLDLLDKWLTARREDRLVSKDCATCRVLENQLFIANNDREKLLEQIIDLTNPKVEPQPEIHHEPLKPAKVPWAVRRNLMEQEDREKARLQRENFQAATKNQVEKQLNEIEKELEEIAASTDNA